MTLRSRSLHFLLSFLMVSLEFEMSFVKNKHLSFLNYLNWTNNIVLTKPIVYYQIAPMFVELVIEFTSVQVCT